MSEKVPSINSLLYLFTWRNKKVFACNCHGGNCYQRILDIQRDLDFKPCVILLKIDNENYSQKHFTYMEHTKCRRDDGGKSMKFELSGLSKCLHSSKSSMSSFNCYSGKIKHKISSLPCEPAWSYTQTRKVNPNIRLPKSISQPSFSEIKKYIIDKESSRFFYDIRSGKNGNGILFPLRDYSPVKNVDLNVSAVHKVKNEDKIADIQSKSLEIDDFQSYTFLLNNEKYLVTSLDNLYGKDIHANPEPSDTSYHFGLNFLEFNSTGDSADVHMCDDSQTDSIRVSSIVANTSSNSSYPDMRQSSENVETFVRIENAKNSNFVNIQKESLISPCSVLLEKMDITKYRSIVFQAQSAVSVGLQSTASCMSLQRTLLPTGKLVDADKKPFGAYCAWYSDLHEYRKRLRKNPQKIKLYIASWSNHGFKNRRKSSSKINLLRKKNVKKQCNLKFKNNKYRKSLDYINKRFANQNSLSFLLRTET